MILTVTEREQYLAELTDAQRSYLTDQLARGKRTAFANSMAAAKGHHVPDDAEPEVIELLLDDWIYSGYTDAGAVSPDLRCECGRPLRYQHRVTHKRTGEVRRFGIEHLKEHLGIDARVVAAIKQGFDAIDYELDELLIKHRGRWEPNAEWTSSPHLTDDMRAQLALGLPLLERQIRRLSDRERRARAEARIRPRTDAEYAPQAGVRPADLRTDEPPLEQEIEAPVDLFDWLERLSDQEPESGPAGSARAAKPPTDNLPLTPGLSPALQAAALAYCADGVKSARVICELLIRDHGAGDERFSTGKPQLYVAVCRAIEAAYPEARIEPHAHEDRYYSLG